MIIADFEITRENTALIIVDLQNYLADKKCGLAKVIHEDMPEQAGYYFERLYNEVIPTNVKLIDYFRANDLDLIYITVGPQREDGRDFLSLRKTSHTTEGKNTVTTIPVQGTYAHNIISEIKPLDGEMVLNKTTRSAFTSTGLDQILRNMGKDTLAFTGAITNACVETTARDAADRGYKTILVEDACAAVDRESQELTMRNYRIIFGKVLAADELIEALDR